MVRDGLGWKWLRESSQKGKTHDDRWRVRTYLWACSCSSCAKLGTPGGSIETVSDGTWFCRAFLHNLRVQIDALEAIATDAVRDGEALLRAMLGRRDYHMVRLAATW